MAGDEGQVWILTIIEEFGILALAELFVVLVNGLWIYI